MIWRNSTAAPGTNKHQLIVFVKHLLIWVIWYGVSSLVVIGYNQPLTTLFWGHLSYDFSSLVLVFYGTAFFVKQWFDAQHRQQLNAPAAGNGFWQQAHTAWGAVLAILTGYVALSVFIDRNFLIDEPSSLLDYTDRRLSRVLPYTAAAIMYGHFRSEQQWYNALLEEAYAQLSLMREQYFQITTFTERLSSRMGDAATDTLWQPDEWKNNMPSATAKSPLTIMTRHTLLWVVWFGLSSLSLIAYAPTFTALDWLLIATDYSTLVLGFYGMAFFIKKYFLNLKQSPQQRRTIVAWFQQWIRIELFAVLMILCNYITLSVFLSQRFPYAGSPVISSFVYAWRYFNYALPYVMIAALFSYFATRRQVKRIKLRGLNFQGERFAQINADSFIINQRRKNLSGIN
jgi:hypothetical protein